MTKISYLNHFLLHLGTLAVIWYAAWVWIVREGPEKDTHISEDELKYIQSSLGQTGKAKVKHPWADIFTSKPFYAICVAQFAELWGFYTLLTQFPSFLKG